MSSTLPSDETVTPPTPSPSATPPATPAPDLNKRRMVPVWDPESQSLKGVTVDQAKQLADENYLIGAEAQNKELMNSPLGRLGSGITSFANAYTAGGFNALLAATGRKDLLRTEQATQDENPLTATAGTLTGFGASALAGPLRAGGLPGGLLKASEGIAGLSALARVGNVALQGAPAMAMEGALNEYTQQKMLDHPATVEGIASSAASSVLWNAGLSVLGHGILKIPGGLRSTTGNFLDKLEDWGIKRNYSKIVEDEATSKVTSHTKIFDVEYAADAKPGDPPQIIPTDRQLGSAPEALEDPVIEFSRKPTERPRHLRDMAESGPFYMKGEVLPKQAEISAVDRVLAKQAERGPLVQPEIPAFEMPRAAVSDTSSNAAQNARFTAAQPHASPDMPRAGISPKAIPPEPPSLNPEDYEVGFSYDPKASKANRIASVRMMMKNRITEMGDAALEKWDIIRRRAAEYKATEAMPDSPEKTMQLLKITEEKEMAQRDLFRMIPKEIDSSTGIFKPSYKELHDELALQHNKITTNTPKGKYGPVVPDEHIAAMKKHKNDLVKFEQEQANADKVIKRANEKADIALKRAQDAYDKKVKGIAERHAKLAAKQEDADTQALIRAAGLDAEKAGKQNLKADREATANALKEAKAVKEALKKEQRLADIEKAEADRRVQDALKKETQAATKAKAEAEAAAKAARANEPKPPKTKSSETVTGEKLNEDGSREYHSTTRTEANGRIRERRKVTVTAPVVEAKYEGKAYDPLFSSVATSMATNVAAFTRNPLAVALAGGMHAANFGLKVAGHREAIGPAFEKILGGLAKTAVPAIKASTRTYWSSGEKLPPSHTYSAKEYQAAIDTVRFAASNPAAISEHIQKAYPETAKNYPEVVAGVAATVTKMATALDNKAVKKPFDPAMREGEFLPPRAMQVAFMRSWHQMANPHLVAEHGDVRNMDAIKEVLPNTYDAQREAVMRYLQDPKNKISARQARQLSGFLGTAIRPVDKAAALKRLQQTAGPDPIKKTSGGGGGGRPSRISNQAATRDATGFDQSQM